MILGPSPKILVKECKDPNCPISPAMLFIFIVVHVAFDCGFEFIHNFNAFT